ncbi:MAG: TonB-dependent receptor [Massilibacteroides sp.]|nr:TonB-dependent receptor [Massilibacteroides sp.]MDD3061732.1 TonB-dependent receptor [Massilibacteroides sp.]MDD4115162.1 TonB-dependent receptor [Massilibacteroides sp.]MDD4660615.1 TonB-dependent receptor [Massilibacteroides sp.]
MKRTLLISCLYLIIPFFLTAQNEENVLIGNVKDPKGQRLANVTLLLLNSSDSSYITGAVTDLSGHFSLQRVVSGNYLIEVSMLGYKKKLFPLQVQTGKVQSIPSIILEEDVLALSGVVVTAEKKQIELEAGKTVVTISSSFAGAKSSAFDVLKNIPGVLVREDGSIYLYGQSGVNVLIDDKLTYMSGESLANLLRSIPSASVGRIELTTHPSSRYDASGNSGLINIQTKKVKIQGLNLSIYSNFQQGKRARGYESINFSMRRDRLNLYTDYSYNWGEDFNYVVSDRYYPLTESSSTDILTLEMTANRQMRHKSHFVRGRVGYEFSDRITLDAYGTANWYEWRKRERTNSRFFTSSVVDDSLRITQNSLNVKYTNLTGGMSLTYIFKEKGKWDMSYDFQRFGSESNQIQNSRFETNLISLDKDKLIGNTDGDIDINTGQINVTYPFSERTILDAGAKTAFISIANKALYKNYILNEWVSNKQLSNSFFYDENINAGYVKIKTFILPFLSLDAGLRLENTNVKSRLSDLTERGDSLFSDHYTNLFPNLVFQYNLSENHLFSLMYGRRINRPNYRDLNPFIEINDTYLYEQGNTKLKPEFSDNFEWSYFFKQQYGVSIQYSHRTNPIAKSYIIKENQLVVVTPKNLRTNHSYKVRLSLNNLKPFSWWTMHVNGTLTYNRFSWELNDVEEINECLTPMIHLSNQLVFPYGWTAEVTGFFNGWMAEGQAHIHPLGQVSVGIRKNILKNKASLQFFVEDIFATDRVHIDLIGTTRGWYTEKRDSRRVGLLFIWRFNSGSTIKDSRQRDRLEESKRINL